MQQSGRRRANRIILIVAGSIFGFFVLLAAIGAAVGGGKKTSSGSAAPVSSPVATSAAASPVVATGSPKPAAPSKPAAPPASGGSFKDANTILTKLAAAGLVCGGPSQMAEDAAVLFDPGATSLITCDSPGGTAADTQVVVFDTAANLNAYEQQIEGTVTSVPGGQLGGVNWVLESTPGYATKARTVLGGRYTLIAADTAPAFSAQAPQPAPSTAQAPGCYPLTNGGNCYRPGEYCRTSDRGTTGVDGDGDAIKCEDNDGWRWERV